MIRNFLKIALRNLKKDQVFSLINISGLAIGITVCTLICLYVVDELSYDRFHENADRIVRLDVDIRFGGSEESYALSSAPSGATLKADYPFVEDFVRLRGTVAQFKKDDQIVTEYEVAFADSSLFEVFSFPVLAGNPKKALSEPNSAVITESIAQKYFATKEAIGKSLVTQNNEVYKVSAVIKDIPTNSHLQRNIYISMLNLQESKETTWLRQNFITYILLKDKSGAGKLQEELPQIINKYLAPEATRVFNIKSFDDFAKAGNYVRFVLTPLLQIHLHSSRIGEISPGGNVYYVYIFSAIAAFILLIAGINFTNLSTARSTKRAKEVGVRKVLGSLKASLIKQFLAESVLLSFIALILAIGLVYLLLPFFNDLAAKRMVFSLANNPLLFITLFAFAILTGLLAGSYPAFFLSAFKPAEVLKGKFGASAKGGYLRSGLVVFQFFASSCLIICTAIIYLQLDHIEEQNLGFNREQLLIINQAEALGTGIEGFKNEVIQLPEVKNGTISPYLPVPSWRSNNSYFPEGEIQQDRSVTMQNWGIDNDYIATMGMQIIKGRDFDPQRISDSSAIIINETAAQVLGFTDPIGQKIFSIKSISTGEKSYFTIIGVVKNFNYESLRANVGALGMLLAKSNSTICFRIETKNLESTIGLIEAKWKSKTANQPLDYVFMDEAFDSMYRSEQRLGKIFISFAVLAILTACLGLFGLATFTAEQRTKEIGIRKVLGASVFQITALLSKDFLRLVLIAFVIASPIAYYLMDKWLADFAYRITIGWWIFALAGLLAIGIALATVSWQSIRAALANPVKSLRSE
jgi:putative ABC transport system permease protein